MSNRKRVSFTLDPAIVADLRFTSSRLGVSSSVLVSDLLAGPVRDMRRLLESLPDSPTERDVVRFRGESIEVVNQRLSDLRGLLDGDLSDGNG